MLWIIFLLRPEVLFNVQRSTNLEGNFFSGCPIEFVYSKELCVGILLFICHLVSPLYFFSVFLQCFKIFLKLSEYFFSIFLSIYVLIEQRSRYSTLSVNRKSSKTVPFYIRTVQLHSLHKLS